MGKLKESLIVAEDMERVSMNSFQAVACDDCPCKLDECHEGCGDARGCPSHEAAQAWYDKQREVAA